MLAANDYVGLDVRHLAANDCAVLEDTYRLRMVMQGLMTGAGGL